jgi:TetR/AcrR family transcriptional regulator, cholesterol catabolism regulator
MASSKRTTSKARVGSPSNGSSTKNGSTTADRVWTVAAELFYENGYDATTTRELADRLGITRASLYYHVTKKEDLLHGVCVEALHRVTESVQHAVEAETNPRAQIRALILTHLTSMLTDIEMHATMLLNLQRLTGDQLSDVIGLRNTYESLVASVVRGAQAAGTLRSDISNQNLTLALLNMVNWTVTWYRPGGRVKPRDLAQVLADVYLDGAISR